MAHSDQFTKATDHDRAAFEGCVAVWFNGGENVAIFSPNLDSLRSSWKKIVGATLLDDMVQYARIIQLKPVTEEKAAQP